MTQHPYHPGPSQPTPEQRLLLMSAEDWELFIEDCAQQQKTEGFYIQIHRLGGAGDKGRDVCGYCQSLPTESTWDLYQAKHYDGALSPSEFLPELAKFLTNVFTKSYTQPRDYFICALRVGPKLFDLIMSPSELKKWTLYEWEKRGGDFGTYKHPFSAELKLFLEQFPFNIIKIKTAKDLLEIHSRSPRHWEVFGILASRGFNPDVPDIPSLDEQNYIEALLKVYRETSGTPIPDVPTIPNNYQKHFKSQRKIFYSAEGLHRFSRDKLPGSFDDLLDQVETGISSDLNFPHPDGITRLRSVLTIANSLQVTSNPLHMRLQAGDLQGACHHLANNTRLSWIEENTDE